MKRLLFTMMFVLSVWGHAASASEDAVLLAAHHGDGLELAFHYDAHQANRVLKVAAWQPRSGPHQAVYFMYRSNYATWLSRGEVLVFQQGKQVARLPLSLPSSMQPVAWTAEKEGQYQYQIRVYDAKGHSDVSQLQSLLIQATAAAEPRPDLARIPTRLATSDIPLAAGTVSLSGHVPEHIRELQWQGMRYVFPAADRRVQLAQMMPAGSRQMKLRLVDKLGRSQSIRHQVEIPVPLSIAAPIVPKGKAVVPVEAAEQVAAKPVAAFMQAPTSFQLIDESKDDGFHLHVAFDGLDQHRRLNVTAWPNRVAIAHPVYFRVYSNYHHWIKRAELRIFDLHADQASLQVALPIDLKKTSQLFRWSAERAGAYRYVLRVYDAEGHYDETHAGRFSVSADFTALSDLSKGRELLDAGYGVNQLALKAIPINGGMLRMSGILPDDYVSLEVQGIRIPLDKKQHFALHTLMPSGEYDIALAMKKRDGSVLHVQRQVNIPASEWFATGIADMTIGRQSASKQAAALNADATHYNGRTYVDGRLAGYAKGRFANGVKLTAAVDTKEQPLKHLFSKMNARDPRAVLRHLKEKPAYETYGDDSHIIEDAPTQGKFYLRAEKDKSSILWGDFRTELLATELAQINRSLYGAVAHLESNGQTLYGEPKSQLDAFAAQPDTLSVHQSFRGTGGSLYYLRHGEVTQGSTKVRLEVRALNSANIIYAQDLQEGRDYRIDSMQGRILLNRPLPSTPDRSVLPGMPERLLNRPDELFMVVDYEYMPVLVGLKDREQGGHISQWLGNHVQLGVTADQLKTASAADQRSLMAADMTLRYKPATFARFEVAQTNGAFSSAITSNDGGYNVVGQPALGRAKAKAWRVDLSASLRDMGNDEMPDMHFATYVQKRKRGFSSPGKEAVNDVIDWESRADLPLGMDQSSGVSFVMGQRKEKTQQQKDWLRATGHTDFHDVWFSSADLYADRLGTAATPLAGASTGSMAELTAKLGRIFHEDSKVYVLGRSTVKKRANTPRYDGVGPGVEWRVNDRLTMTGEALFSKRTTEGRVATDYQYNEATKVYMAYETQPSSTGFGQGSRSGSLVTGLRSRFAENQSMYVEEHWLTGQQAGLTQSYGLDLQPAEAYTIGLAYEHGRLTGIQGDIIKHSALSISQQYGEKEWTIGLGLEGRRDTSVLEHRQTIVARLNSRLMLDDDWRLLWRADGSRSKSSQGPTFAGDFIDTVVAFAYRPVDDDRWDALLSYQYFENLPSASQISTVTASQYDYRQRSHVLSADADVSVTGSWRVGGKFAVRTGMIQQGRTGQGQWFRSTTELAIARTSLHLVERWDGLLEWRVLRVLQAQDQRSGFVVGLYRHIGDHMKLGGGYNFTNFSDQLTDFTTRTQGWYVNVVGKY